jgi:outer membrane cobalamin receptor
MLKVLLVLEVTLTLGILINGRPSALAGFGDTNVLSQLPAEAERVEVITSPSARYDAEGAAGILNIILRKKKKENFKFNDKFECRRNRFSWYGCHRRIIGQKNSTLF